MLWWLIALTFVVVLLVYRLFTIERSADSVLPDLNAALDTTKTESQLTEQIILLRAELTELRSGVIGVGQRVLELEEQLSQQNQHIEVLTERQQALEMTEPESKIYSRAMKMVQLGADLDEIIRECELPRAEAELLFNLHQQKS
ncbi:DUF2802 domain-containing protein [Alkalimonas collagenimarina]|uniref:DUF2802 domain-containing protein n=1 Tax=Alkalimonas collagenimarina TaxID=400390 RepID=A0ABT9H3C5_9GAMM|nr:DUF2802 domain-containing protein [Alkalimonas collagenimarina]MDP4537564.1 DUF2802 domain-containing protein [Alkalimonas collagenimarina]